MTTAPIPRSQPDIVERMKGYIHGEHDEYIPEVLQLACDEIERLRGAAQEAPEPVAWRLTDGEGDYEYLTEEPSDQSRAWSRRYGREWEPLYASPVPSTDKPGAA